jgi:hypothetical protein
MDTIAKGIFTAYPQLKEQYKSILEGANVKAPPQLKVGRYTGSVILTTPSPKPNSEIGPK